MSQKAGLQKAFFKKKKQCKILELYKLIICTNPVYFPNISFVIQQQNFVKSILKSITVYNENKNAWSFLGMNLICYLQMDKM